MRVPFDYAVIRLVPRVEREEFINVGVVLRAPTRDRLACLLRLDRPRAAALDPTLDLDAVERHLAAFAAVCEGAPAAGPIAALPGVERFRWLVAPRSAAIQCSAVHGGLCDDPDLALRDLFERRVGPLCPPHADP